MIATKCGERRFDPAAGLSRRYIIQQVEQSLRRLGTDYIDLYYAHFPDPDTPLDQTLAIYDDLVRQGKLRYVALSNHPAWQVTHAMWIADNRRLAAAPVCVQVKYNLIDRAAEQEMAPACQQFGLSIVPFGPLHGGLLAGPRSWSGKSSGDKRFGGPGSPQHELAIGRDVERLSHDWGLRPHQVSLAWLLSRPAVASAIVGAETVDEITANASAADIDTGTFPARRPDGVTSQPWLTSYYDQLGLRRPMRWPQGRTLGRGSEGVVEPSAADCDAENVTAAARRAAQRGHAPPGRA